MHCKHPFSNESHIATFNITTLQHRSFPSGAPCRTSSWEEYPNQHQPASRCGSEKIPFDLPWQRSSTGVLLGGR